MPASAAPATDGRRARRDRNRAAVIDAMFALLEDGVLPSTEAVAERAGVSVSSVFRYFDSLDDLHQQTIDVHMRRFGHLFDLPGIGVGTRDERVGALVRARVTLHSTVAPIARLARSRQLEAPLIEQRLHEVRAGLHQQTRDHFAAELDTCRPAERDDHVAAIECLTSFESWDLLSVTHGRSDRLVQRTWTVGVDALLPR